jgi:polysaccharide export outer membrane protein
MEAGIMRRYSAGMKLLRCLFATFCAAAALVGQTAIAAESPETVKPVTQSTSSQLVRLGAGDQIQVDIYGIPDMRTVTSVAADGTVRMPLIGAVKVMGLLPTEAQDVIAKTYRDGEILVDPAVTVQVTQSSSQRATVRGQVRNEGRYPVESTTTVLDLIALAGGITESGSDIVFIQRSTEAGMQEIRVDTRRPASSSGTGAAQMESPKGGDTIFVPKSVYYINGAVAQGGEFPIRGDVDISLAVARAGGVTDLGSPRRIVIRRKNPEGKYIEIKVSLTDKTKTTPIKPDDVIEVKERIF